MWLLGVTYPPKTIRQRFSKVLLVGAAQGVVPGWLLGEHHTCPPLSQRTQIFMRLACQLGVLSPRDIGPGSGEVGEQWSQRRAGSPLVQGTQVHSY